MSRRRAAETAVLITGFQTEPEVDQFVMAEIRYFKSMEMQANRCEGPALRFEFRDLRSPGELFQAISSRYPSLVFLVDDGALTLEIREGELKQGGEIRRFAEHPPTEEIYSTF
jgi:hypothetical protein